MHVFGEVLDVRMISHVVGELFPKPHEPVSAFFVAVAGNVDGDEFEGFRVGKCEGQAPSECSYFHGLVPFSGVVMVRIAAALVGRVRARVVALRRVFQR